MRNIVPAIPDDISSCEWIDGPKIRLGNGLEIGPNLTAPHLWVVGKPRREDDDMFFMDKVRLRFNKKQHPHAIATIESLCEKGEERVCIVCEVLPGVAKEGEPRVVHVGVFNAWCSSQQEMDELLEKRKTIMSLA